MKNKLQGTWILTYTPATLLNTLRDLIHIDYNDTMAVHSVIGQVTMNEQVHIWVALLLFNS